MPDDRALLLQFLADHDGECDACGHGLRGITSDRCPECGRALSLKVSAKDAPFAPWLTAIVSISLAAGFDGVVATATGIAHVVLVLIRGQKGPPAAFPICFGLAAGVLLFFIAWTATQRRAWGRLSTRAQWFRTALIFVAVLIPHAAVGGWFAKVL